MISVSVRGDKIIHHFGLVTSDFKEFDWTTSGSTLEMNPNPGSSKEAQNLHHNLPSGIEEYDPEEDYEEEEYEDEVEEHVKKDFPTTPSPTATTLTTPPSPTLSPTNFLRFLRKLGNITRDAGTDIRLNCEAEGIPAPRSVKWFKNGVQEQLKGDRVRIKSARKKTLEGKKSPIRIISSTLRIRQLEVLDKGFYSCEVVGGDGKRIKSTGILDVVHDTGLESGVIPDFPSPFDSFPEIGEGGSVHRIDSFHRTGLSGSGARGESPFGLNPNNPEKSLQPPKDGHGFCQTYHGTICKKYVENRTIYVSSEDSQFHLESKLKDAITLIKHTPEISPECSTFGIPSLCYHAFPLCPSPSSSKQFSPENRAKFSLSPHRLCREECDLLQESYCKQEYALARQNPLIGKQIPLPECDHLPSVGSRQAENCVRLGLPSQNPGIFDPTEACFKDKGESYRGPASTSISSKECVPWTSVSKPDFPWNNHKELFGGHNFCRNPDPEGQDAPWCFTRSDSGKVRREACKVDKCGFFGYDDHALLTIGALFSALFLLLFLALLLVCCFRFRNSRSRKKSPNKSSSSTFLTSVTPGLRSSSGTGSGMNGNTLPLYPEVEMSSLLRYTTNGNGLGMCNNSNPPGTVNSGSSGFSFSGFSVSGKIPEIPVSHVHLTEELGLSPFGKVFKGEVLLRPGEGTFAKTVIKTLKSSAPSKTRHDFFREVELLSELRHPNILPLLGVVTKDEPRCMLFEWMSHGDLHEFLISHSPRGDPALTEWILDGNEMLFIATQIAAGMEYLACHHYVHRDLAARNALVGDGLTVKISDFGLSREIYNSDYYRVQSKNLVPVRWMPPEAIMYGKFSTESDVWSFGVVLWEIYSYGLQPYLGYSNQEVLEVIRARQLLPCPDLCPPRMYSLMVECWAELPPRRPSFEELHSRLKQWLLPLLGPNSNFSPHIHSQGQGQGQGVTLNLNHYSSPFPLPTQAPPSCASNNSMSSHQSSNATGPLSNNTNSTSVSANNPWQQQQQGLPPQPQTQLRSFSGGNSNSNSGNSNSGSSNGHCVAYQSTPIVNCGGQGGNYYQNASAATAHFHAGSGRISHTSGPHSPSPYRVFMESKSTNI